MANSTARRLLAVRLSGLTEIEPANESAAHEEKTMTAKQLAPLDADQRETNG